MNKFNRLVGLDILRCLLMLIGPIYHISHLFTTNNQIINTTNDTIYDFFSIFHSFRMEVFFVLSGFFATFLIEKKGKNLFTKSRINSIYIPLLFSLLIIWPITLSLDNFFSNQSRLSLNHIWFLVSLGIISIGYLFFYNSIKRIIYKINSLNLLIILITIPILGVLAIATNSIITLYLEKFHSSLILIFIYKNIIYYPIINIIPTILGSCLYYKSYSIQKKFYPFIIISFLILHSIFISISFNELESIYKIILRMIYIFTTSCLILILFNSFKNLTIKSTPLIDFLVKASFTIYIIHPPLVFINGVLMSKIVNNIFSQFLFINILTYTQCFLLFILISNTKIGRKFFGIKSSEIKFLHKIKRA